MDLQNATSNHMFARMQPSVQQPQQTQQALQGSIGQSQTQITMLNPDQTLQETQYNKQARAMQIMQEFRMDQQSRDNHIHRQDPHILSQRIQPVSSWQTETLSLPLVTDGKNAQQRPQDPQAVTQGLPQGLAGMPQVYDHSIWLKTSRLKSESDLLSKVQDRLNTHMAGSIVSTHHNTRFSGTQQSEPSRQLNPDLGLDIPLSSPLTVSLQQHHIRSQPVVGQQGLLGSQQTETSPFFESFTMKNNNNLNAQADPSSILTHALQQQQVEVDPMIRYQREMYEVQKQNRLLQAGLTGLVSQSGQSGAQGQPISNRGNPHPHGMRPTIGQLVTTNNGRESTATPAFAGRTEFREHLQSAPLILSNVTMQNYQKKYKELYAKHNQPRTQWKSFAEYVQ